MSDLRRTSLIFWVLLLVVGGAILPALAERRGDPARIDIKVLSGAVRPGEQATVQLRLEPAKGVKINRYPQIKLSLPGHAGLYESATAVLGNPTPPPADRMDDNYFKKIDPIEIKLSIADNATPGIHMIEAQLVYFYCVTDSGYCAPARIPLSIELNVQ